MLYREAGQFKTSYQSDNQIFPIRQDRYAIGALMLAAAVAVPLLASPYLLSAILIPAMTMRWFDGRDAADAFVSRRIDNVMAFEKWKAGKDFDAPLRKVTEVLSQMRYGAKAE